jgi:hypothetical protein
MINVLSTRPRRIALGLGIIVLACVQFLLISNWASLTSSIGLGLQVGIAVALIYSGSARRHPTER